MKKGEAKGQITWLHFHQHSPLISRFLQTCTMSYSFPGVALVTGSASGIGQGIAMAFAKDGCKKLALCDCNVDGMNETKDHVSKTANDCQVLCVPVDLCKENQVKEMVEAVVGRFGRVDYAVNTAGTQNNTTWLHYIYKQIQVSREIICPPPRQKPATLTWSMASTTADAGCLRNTRSPKC